MPLIAEHPSEHSVADADEAITDAGENAPCTIDDRGRPSSEAVKMEAIGGLRGSRKRDEGGGNHSRREKYTLRHCGNLLRNTFE
jgi:hypothetical protein